MRAQEPSILTVEGVEVVYDDAVLVLRGVSLFLGAGEIVAVLGANGAGKTTLLRSITGLGDLHNARVTKGRVFYDGDDITTADPAHIVKRGMSQVMEGRRIFAELSVEDNLRAGAYTVRSRHEAAKAHNRVMEMFPVLAKRSKSTAGYLSGGEQQMLAIGRALMASPKVLLLDEPSLGLAPMIVAQIGEIISTVNEAGTSVLLVEQNAAMALALADRGYVLENGRVVAEGQAADLAADDDIREFYLGLGDGGRRSFRDTKSYRRSKQWTP